MQTPASRGGAPPPSSTSGGGRGRVGLAVSAALPPLALLVAELALFGGDWQFPLDDSYIHLVFARSLAAGEGLAFNPGELVAGTTSPLWTALVALISLLPGPVLLWTKLTGIGCQVGVVLATSDLALRLGLAPRRALAAALLVASTGWLVWSAPSGMEVPLFTWLTLAGIARHVAEGSETERGAELPPLSLLLFAGAALARPEGLLLLPLAAADRLRSAKGRASESTAPDRRWRDLFVGTLAAAVLLVPVAWAFERMSGSVLPTTFVAKSSGPPILVPQLGFLKAVFLLLFTSQPWLTLLAFAGVVETIRRRGGAKDRGLLLALWFLSLPVASAMLSSGREIALGNFGRYFFPLLPVAVLLGVLALDRLAVATVRRRIGALGVWISLGVLALPTALGLVRSAGIYLRAVADVRASDVAIARWLAPRLDPRAVVAVTDIGAIRWLLRNPVLDLVGIVDPEIASRRRSGAIRGESYPAVLLEIVERRKPDFLVVYPDWFALPERDPVRFPRLHLARIPGNLAMAGDMIAVYATPWTRWPLSPPADPETTSTERP